jgi:hypothetical protein
VKRHTRKQAIGVPFQHRQDASDARGASLKKHGHDDQYPPAIRIKTVWASLIVIHVLMFAYLHSGL